MLQEILLSLSGVSSPIWEELKNKETGTENLNGYVSLPEQAMLAKLSHLSRLHIEVKSSSVVIASKHPSLICRAVGSSIAHVHLAAFRRRIVEVESSIIRQDAAYVGGYQIIPLSTLVADFSPWIRRLEWLQELTRFMKASASKRSVPGCTAAAVLDFLETERHTGFTDLEACATQLLIVAQRTWVRSLSAWILYAQLSSYGADDFMVRRTSDKDIHEHGILVDELIPKFVSSVAASNILAIGNALGNVQSSAGAVSSSVSRGTQAALLSSHLAEIKVLQYPLHSSSFESTIVGINESISHHALSRLLPRHTIIETCMIIQDYLMLGRGEFGIALIENSDARVLTRQKLQSSTRPVRKLGRMDDMLIKDAELNAILSKTWADLAYLQDQNDAEDDTFNTAKKYLKLKIVQEDHTDPKPVLLTTLLPMPTLLQIELPTQSPLKIFLPESTVQQYSQICAYLLSIRRSQLRVSSLWKLTSHRRCHPAPLGPPLSVSDFGRRTCELRRKREATRSTQMRRFWSSLNKSLFLLNELNSYLHDEVIANSWKQFKIWLNEGLDQNDRSERVLASSTLSVKEQPAQATRTPSSQFKTSLQSTTSNDDPRTLTNAHAEYLKALTFALLVNDAQMISITRSLLELLDHFVGLFSRLASVWQGHDLQEDDGVMDVFTNFAQEEKDIVTEMDRARIELEKLLEQFVTNIKAIEKSQDVDNLSGTTAGVAISHDAQGGFVPWRARTLGRLIMKLDFLVGVEERRDDLVDELDDD